MGFQPVNSSAAKGLRDPPCCITDTSKGQFLILCLCLPTRVLSRLVFLKHDQVSETEVLTGERALPFQQT